MTQTGYVDQLSEAVAPDGLLARLKQMHQGEVVRLQGGTAVKRMSTEDGRDIFKIGTPDTYSREDLSWYGSGYRSAEDAAVEAFRRSAQSVDPDSIGGTERIGSYIEYDGIGSVSDTTVRLRGFTPKGLAIVGPSVGGGETETVKPEKLKRATKTRWGLTERLSEAEFRERSTAAEPEVLAELDLQLETFALLEADELLCGEDVEWMRWELSESAKTAGYASTHAPIGKGGKNWITADKPGNTGQLPAYIQNVRNAIVRGGKSVEQATAIAIGRIKKWAAGAGDVGAEVKTAAAKAIAEWNAMKARAKGKSSAKSSGKVSESSTPPWLPSSVKGGFR